LVKPWHSSHQQIDFNIEKASFRKGHALAGEDHLDIEIPDFSLSGDIAGESEELLTQLESIAARQASSYTTEPLPPEIPLLGRLVPDAESCAIFSSSSNRHQLYPIAVANLPLEYVYSLINECGADLLAATKQAEPYIVINLPNDKRFEALGELSYRYNIRTLWLVPLSREDGSIFGTFLFTSRKSFSPGRKAVVSVTLLTAWMSAMLRQVDNQQPDYGFIASFDDRETFGTKIEDNLRMAAIDRLIKDLIYSRQDRQNAGNPDTPDSPAGNLDSGNTRLHLYRDKHGLPVTYDTETLKKRKQAKSDAISILTHELLSPLTLIKGYTATLLQLSEAISEEEKEQYLKGIDSASDRVIRLLENLQDMTQLEETEAIYAEPVHFFELIHNIVAETQSQTTKHVIKLQPSPHLPRVRVDPERIDQVIRNLLANAIKYSPQGGDIEVDIQVLHSEQELRRISGNTPPVKFPCLVVSIADSGIGMPESELDNIFERFYRINSNLTRTIPGTGLGLYICNIIVEAHGGHIWARNRHQGGSIISFSLPL